MDVIESLLHGPTEFAASLSGMPWLLRCQIVSVAAALSAIYLRAIVARVLHPSLFSTVLATPVFLLNAWLPLLFVIKAELISRTAVVFLFTWLGNMKVGCFPVRRTLQ